jgi:hypothetical protein
MAVEDGHDELFVFPSTEGVPPEKLSTTWVCFTFIGKESSTAILAVFARAGSPCYVV